MKNRKVLNLRTHIGGILAKTSYDSVKNTADMELTAVGVLIKSIKQHLGVKAVNVLIPFPNVVEVVLAPESEIAKVEDEVKELKRKPGRPPNPEPAA